MASQAAASMPSLAQQDTTATATTAAAEVSRPKPCCVCKDEKARRDDCMLFSKAADPQKDCQSTIELYKSCMLGFGFKI
ncbi:cytochrome c oxidase copper chaperone [Echria macrotheca]|uniref:Cytochrome c oxidase copper chaperone n=1 Tax=Echria macrotheca TaxID=438768 RepID=A0AAJ0BBT7_9PEZI|nr:cytochrome c oxidase copper chaperone [Echria macrotheca]